MQRTAARQCCEEREVQYWLIIHFVLLGYYTWYICCMFLMDVMHIIHTIRLVYIFVYLQVLPVYLRKIGDVYLQKVSYTNNIHDVMQTLYIISILIFCLRDGV